MDDHVGYIVAEEFFDQFGIRAVTYTKRAESTALFLESATIQLGKLPLGEMGQLLPPLAKQYDLRDAVYLLELNLDQLLARRIAGNWRCWCLKRRRTTPCCRW